jgi:hypothetical protein
MVITVIISKNLRPLVKSVKWQESLRHPLNITLKLSISFLHKILHLEMSFSKKFPVDSKLLENMQRPQQMAKFPEFIRFTSFCSSTL